MGTLHPSPSERRAIQRRAAQGDKSAKHYLELLDACTQTLEASNGISLARGMVGEHNDVYSQAIDDALSELMPVIFKISAAGWESLKFYVPSDASEGDSEEPADETREDDFAGPEV